LHENTRRETSKAIHTHLYYAFVSEPIVFMSYLLASILSYRRYKG